ncbi:hypothetical protein A3A93_04300 [Candidatus Roizmanbacteria bacterium RIFCSPLOWO2_01_FULL_38_12]|uniref:Lactamase n=1 Tax=Candidatus Roizmanbacteria bacterium RIFCSPLOWO2_01_FULL_38_12 TaxID=1802061 RepID=A0A1F7IXD2_9BACT|nr:MAG: hypothetical protein A2861_01195 [Candidatus Roizmanbacteria bacterium RIFCSPHIGHO2_01_FULL_38_15]OGK35462.1 MAG: hypothetical protein A3F59_00805 [Candidatus Roizmanbacteria bacterium RIFCSPHIGHO2_12_FULL_38_13]OGK47995.1 MAG: hypothetical protein A3A93_04300 [Candidatus Roizmanbacteria bacterium RIFCSPLOWO2_01_FULL_38_12]
MEIKYFGHSSFFIKTKFAKIVTDPFDPQMVGLKFPKIEVDIVTVSHSHSDHNYRDNIKEGALFLDWPGEYEKNEVRIRGFSTFHDNKQGAERGENVIYKIEAEGVKVLHCGDLGHSLDEATVELIGSVDILLIPTGGVYTIGPDEAVKVVQEIEPSLVIPMHYGRPELNQATFKDLAPVENFLKEMGAKDTQKVDKLVVKKEELNPEDMKVVVLSIQ